MHSEHGGMACLAGEACVVCQRGFQTWDTGRDPDLSTKQTFQGIWLETQTKTIEHITGL